MLVYINLNKLQCLTRHTQTVASLNLSFGKSHEHSKHNLRCICENTTLTLSDIKLIGEEVSCCSCFCVFWSLYYHSMLIFMGALFVLDRNLQVQYLFKSFSYFSKSISRLRISLLIITNLHCFSSLWRNCNTATPFACTECNGRRNQSTISQ